MAAVPRKTADQRRADILDAALTEFADVGFDGASTEAIARRAGISQPYLFRLFGTKKRLFIDVMDACLTDVARHLRQVTVGTTGPAAANRAVLAYREWLESDSRHLRAQIQVIAACADPDIRAVTRSGFAAIVAQLEALSVDAPAVADVFRQAMAISVFAMMGLPDADEPWAARVLDPS